MKKLRHNVVYAFSIFYDDVISKFGQLPNGYDNFIHRSPPIKTFELFSINNNTIYIDIEYNQIVHLGLVLKSNLAPCVYRHHQVLYGENTGPTFHYSLCPSFCLRRICLTSKGIINFYILILYFTI